MVPTEIKLHRKSATLELTYAEREPVVLSAEFLRVHSPSAEVRGHGRGQEVLQTGKRYVAIKHIESVGNYAIKLSFDDGHDSGIYSWDYLLELGENEVRSGRTTLLNCSKPVRRASRFRPTPR